MANAKKTQKDYFNEVIALATEAGNKELVEFAKGRIEALEKKAAAKKPTKTQAENEGIKELILANLTDEGVTVSDLMKKDKAFSELELSNQRVSALLRQLIEAGKVAKTVDKKKSYFSLVVEDVVETEA